MVTDPPAGISFMGKEWDDFRRQRNPADAGRDSVFGRTSAHGPQYARRPREAFIQFMTGVMEDCTRVLKPGAHALVWAIPRTSHWTATAIEDAGFEVRDVVTHHFGSGFPKSHDVSKAIDKAAGAERKVVGPSRRHSGGANPVYAQDEWTKNNAGSMGMVETAPATPEAQQWEGWGTALKPASEHWILARAPLAKGTVAANVLEHRTGALNIDGTRVEGSAWTPKKHGPRSGRQAGIQGKVVPREGIAESHEKGRWPANLILSHSAECNGECLEGCPVRELDEQSGTLKSGGGDKGNVKGSHGIFGRDKGEGFNAVYEPNSGGASRFFYVPKASRAERNAGLEGMEETRRVAYGGGFADSGFSDPRMDKPQERRPAANNHPTVKAVALMRYLCRLITPPNGTVLDPFMGSGSTGVAALLEGFSFCGIEKDADYYRIAEARMKHPSQLGLMTMTQRGF
jgi:site-specific DNA-methyltransferase (adenine-specific)